MKSRRRFLTQCTVGGAISLAGSVPRTFSQMAAQARSEREHILVVLFLDGGNDGLNTIVPANDPLYRQHRRECRIQAADAIPLNDDLYLHPSLRNLAATWEDNRLAIVHGVGYPNHNQSHFVSTAVWHSGDVKAQPQYGYGWLGKSLDPLQTKTDAPLAWSLGTLETPHMLRGRHTRTAMPPEMSRSEAVDVLNLLNSNQSSLSSPDVNLVSTRSEDAAAAVEQLLHSKSSTVARFPNSRLGQQFSQIAWLIESGTPAPVYFLKQPGYDTHAGQTPSHTALLSELGDALAVFDKRMHRTGYAQRVTTMVFSEFGRRVAENASGGTDHGKAGPVFLVGGAIRPGLHGTRPDLENADHGNVRVTTDFRSIYRSLLRQMSVRTDPIPKTIERASLFRT